MNGLSRITWQCLRRELTGAHATKVSICANRRQIHSFSTPHTLPKFTSRYGLRAFCPSASVRNLQFHKPDIPSPAIPEVSREGVRINLSQRTTQSLFKGSLSREQANELLSKLQRQRESGTLDTKIEEFSQKATKAGLAYLRSKYPLDEEAAIVARIDNELDLEFRLPQTDVEFSRNERSGLKEIQEDNLKRAKQEEEREKRLGAQQQKSQKSSELDGGSGAQVARINNDTAVQQPRTFKDLVDPNRKRKPPPEWVKKVREEATDNDVPNLTLRQRLLPGALFTVTVVLLSLWFADSYIPPSRGARLFPDIPPAAACLQAIVVANIVVLLLWKVPQMWSFLNKYFMNLPIKPRPSQLFLATISHHSVNHCLLNMALLWLIGIRLHDDIGRGPFLALLVSASVLTSYTTLVVHVLRHYFFTATLGASGVVAAMLSTSCVLHEGLNVKLPFFPGLDMSWVNTGVVLAIIITLEASRFRKGVFDAKIFNKAGHSIDHVGHASGYVVGIGAGAYIRKHDARWREIERRSFWNNPRWAGIIDGKAKGGGDQIVSTTK